MKGVFIAEKGVDSGFPVLDVVFRVIYEDATQELNKKERAHCNCLWLIII